MGLRETRDFRLAGIGLRMMAGGVKNSATFFATAVRSDLTVVFFVALALDLVFVRVVLVARFVTVFVFDGVFAIATALRRVACFAGLAGVALAVFRFAVAFTAVFLPTDFTAFVGAFFAALTIRFVVFFFGAGVFSIGFSAFRVVFAREVAFFTAVFFGAVDELDLRAAFLAAARRGPRFTVRFADALRRLLVFEVVFFTAVATVHLQNNLAVI